MTGRLFLVFAYLVAMGMAIESMGSEKAELPSFELSRHFAAGGYEAIHLKCRGDRTREEAYVCELKRLRNGMQVSQITVDYLWTREQMGKFFRRLASVSPDADQAPSQVLLSYDAQNEGKRLQGKLGRTKGAADPEHIKAVLSLEGSLVSQFYK